MLEVDLAPGLLDLGPLGVLQGLGDAILDSLQNFTIFLGNKADTEEPNTLTDQPTTTIENVTVANIQDLCSEDVAHQAGCDVNALCLVEPADTRGYSCACRPEYIDASPLLTRPGEVCVELMELPSSDPQCGNYCYNEGVCKINDGQPQCRCMEQFAGSRCEIPAVVLFVVFSSVLGALSIFILTFACVYQIRRWIRRNSNPRRRFIDEDDEDNSTIVYKRTDFLPTLTPPKV